MIPQKVISIADTRVSHEVWAAIVIAHEGIVEAVATVTHAGSEPGSTAYPVRFATVRAYTADGQAWLYDPASWRGEFSGHNDAVRDMFLRTHLSRHEHA